MDRLRDDHARCIPILASLDIAETEAFYRDRLGFTVDRHGEAYLLARRDDMEIHFWLTDRRIFAEHTACYVRGGQVVALYEEYRRRGGPACRRSRSGRGT